MCFPLSVRLFDCCDVVYRGFRAFVELVKCLLVDFLNWFPRVIFGSPTFPFNELMDGSFLDVGLEFEDLFYFVTVLKFEFW